MLFGIKVRINCYAHQLYMGYTGVTKINTDIIILNLGEANAEEKSNNYNCTFPEMIKDWRSKFHASSKGETDPVFPFGFVQVLLHVSLNTSSVTRFFLAFMYYNNCFADGII